MQNEIKRGWLNFYVEGNIVEIYVGDKNNKESDYVTSFSIAYIPDFIAGLKEVQRKYPASKKDVFNSENVKKKRRK